MPGRPHHTEKFRSCVADVVKKGESEESAYAICTASFQKSEQPIFEALESHAVRIVALAAASGKSRTAKHDGRDHLVVPVVALVEGVIHPVNAPTRELVKADLFPKTLAAWSGRPLFAGHPLKNGTPVSGNTPDVLETCLGRVFNPRVEGKRLLMEAWLDPSRCAATPKGQRLLERAKANDMIEVSVGVFVDALPNAGMWNGRGYSAEWASMSPDHLALLEEGFTGACSVAMGCGVRAAQKANDIGAEDWSGQSEGLGLRTACGCGGTCNECSTHHAANAAEGVDMERKQRIAALAANTYSTVRSVKALDVLTDEELDQAEKAATEAKAAADKTVQGEGDLKAAQDRIKALEGAAEVLKTEEGFLAAAPQSIRDVVADSKAATKAKIDGLVETLKTAQTAFTEEELRAKPILELEKLTTLLKVEAPVDYSGRGIPRMAMDNTVSYAPPDPYEADLKALQGK